MSTSYTASQTNTFSITHAKYLSAKIATDLLRYTRFYRNPSVEEINRYEAELTALLKEGYLKKVIYGYHRNNLLVEGLLYEVLPDGSLTTDDDPGKIRPGTDVPGESFTSHLWHSEKYDVLPPYAKNAFYAALPIKRVPAPVMALESGYWSSGLNYSAGGRSISRSVIIR